jgi:hypothetical protein
VDYCITGSEALPRYGEPRQTADIDLVLAMPIREFGRIRDAFEADYVVNEPIVARGRAMASVVAQSGLGKADLILDRDDAWARSAMARREAWDHPRLGRVWVLSLEDLILAKLEWPGGISELQLRDCEPASDESCGELELPGEIRGCPRRRRDPRSTSRCVRLIRASWPSTSGCVPCPRPSVRSSHTACAGRHSCS